jgi:hypothetical protein
MDWNHANFPSSGNLTVPLAEEFNEIAICMSALVALAVLSALSRRPI